MVVDMKVAAVVVSFNRKALLLECLDGLLTQTLPLDRIIVVDNKSTDGTLDLLAERGYLANPLIECIAMEENLGGAGGFHEGMKRAVEAGFDWIWLMDDDAEPTPDAYRICAPHLQADCAIVAPLMADAAGEPDFDGLHRGFLFPPSKARVLAVGRPVNAEDITGRETVDIDVCSFVGPFISAKAVAAVGLPLAEFFIHNDDLEYTLRTRKFGRLVLVPGALIKHKQAQLVDRTSMRKTPFGVRERFRYEKLWSSYYGYRNITWLISRGHVPTRKTQLFLWHARLMAQVVAFDDHKISRLKFWNSALLDGLRGHFDNSKARRWMPKA